MLFAIWNDVDVALPAPKARLTLSAGGSRIGSHDRVVALEQSMKLERRVPLPWLLAGAVVACAWCSLLSGLGGWYMARDMASREQQALVATEVAARTDLPPLGVLVTRVDRTGPAARAGIMRGDEIVAIDGVQIQDARDLRDRLRTARPGDTVRLTLLRDRGDADVSVQLASFPDDSRQPYLGVYYTARGDEPADL
jgi:hypothetical protein